MTAKKKDQFWTDNSIDTDSPEHREFETANFLNDTVRLPSEFQLPNWLKIILWNSSSSPFRISRNDGDLFDRLNRSSQIIPEHEAIVRLLAMIAYQDIEIYKLNQEINRVKDHLLNQMERKK